jgi:1-acyl-sn-glycerol-3-phosphate acyltransferase
MRYARFVLRSLWFGAVLMLFMAEYTFLVLRHLGTPPMQVRTRWLSRCSRRTLRVFDIEFKAEGLPPNTGLMVSNHLSYLDILVYSSLTEGTFVSKSEVRHWPVFGWFARMSGTIFVRRTRRMEAVSAGQEIRRVLDQGQLVILFPEGTSTNGSEILPFKSSLLEPATNHNTPLHIGAIHYTLADGCAANEVCYWGDQTFFPHFTNLMTKEHVKARVRFAPVQRPTSDRKQLARYLHGEIAKLKGGIAVD